MSGWSNDRAIQPGDIFTVEGIPGIHKATMHGGQFGRIENGSWQHQSLSELSTLYRWRMSLAQMAHVARRSIRT